ncbi:MAG TPA: hypothetical protein VFC00_30955 [Micromonosporaceae bacterium]|nr:hypothetical protein [Micromonosporaceae bacterium]
MGAIKAIETEYKGHLMRSRLEARWAVFFDALGIPWHYEEQGYELPSGRYLPDFRIEGGALVGSADLWVEVKGKLEHDAFVKVVRAAYELPRDPTRLTWPQVLLLCEVPEPGDPTLMTRIDARPDGVALQRVRWRGFLVGTSRANTRRHYSTEPIGDPEVFPIADLDRWTEAHTIGIRHWADGNLIDFTLQHDREVAAAHRAARSARFEHGQSGAML